MFNKKADWILVKEAEQEGLVASMTSLIEKKQQPIAEMASTIFRKRMPNYNGSFGEEESEELIEEINKLIEEAGLSKHKLKFPNSGGVDIVLLPITPNLSLKLMIADEYYGGGEYSKYIMADFFVITEETTDEDVEKLIEFVEKYLN